ncbi:SiaB family protein kinase [Telmatospirillum sp. J64-1]|uniref:SiaB family protein kinase n=1 Tax=Telmatospirillum sp. J64-1 TaxID=2502183 RepID=UPI002103D1F8|nr:SiaB family protein kinase [Telmatospirillum sp. J64-1]
MTLPAILPSGATNFEYREMLAAQYANFKRSLDEKGIIFSFSGYVSEGILFSLGEALRQKMTLEDADVTTVKKVFSVFVEQVQNIIRYSADRIGEAGRSELSSGMVIIGMQEGDFFIVCGNVVRQDDVPRLRERLDHIRSLDRDELKAHYRQQLREAPEDGSKGATIGLIEIARRASSPLEYDFEEWDDQRAFFCLKVSI